MNGMKVLYIPAVKKTFDVETARKQRSQTSEVLKSVSAHLFEPEDVLGSVNDVSEFINSLEAESIDYVIYQSLTFTDGEYIREVINRFSVPVMVWSIREPEIGGRLRLNSLTGGNSTSHVLRAANHPYDFVFGNSDESQVLNKLRVNLNVQSMIKNLQSMKIGVVGEHPPGFFFADTDEELLQKQFGVQIHSMQLERAFEQAKQTTASMQQQELDRAETQVIGLQRSEETTKKFSEFCAYMRQEIREENLSALAIRCLPEFFTEFGAAACSTLSQLTEDGVSSACETDIHGALSMHILNHLSLGASPYLGDMVHVNEASNSVVFWHCGAGAYSLANEKQGAQAGVHPNRKTGMTMEFGLKAGEVTIFRVSYLPMEGFRLLIMKGKALDTPQRFNGTSVEVELCTPVTETVQQLMEGGYEPHYGLVYADVTEDLVELGRKLNIPATVYVE
ncbi:L-fucose isomerase [Marinococcus luteus]|uniref:L-fucose isomerase n=1 Tax=Marinococcus luteus TaxID=1122204 RepID=A0A1H2UAK1_9BACI|nr:hypothetical protein [Marinococcus luteus]SDW52484.1 L-fucose isomerase [Marinococcus luteus]